MNVNDKIRLLESQIAKMDVLEKAEDYLAYKSWHQETELLLEQMLGRDSRQLNQFRLYSGRSQVITDDDATNARYDTESYFASIKQNRSLLTGVVSYFRSIKGVEAAQGRRAKPPRQQSSFVQESNVARWYRNPAIVVPAIIGLLTIVATIIAALI